MNAEHHVSVGIPVYNGAPYVEAALRSVLDQTHTDLDVVVVDNASTDATPEILADFDDERLVVVRNPELLPPADNWNLALSRCAGPFVKLVCADDLLHPECLQRQVQALSSAGPSAVLAASRRRVIDDRSRAVVVGRGLDGLSGTVRGSTAVRACVRAGTNLLGEPAAVLLRRSALDRVSGFDPSQAYMIDVDLWFRVLTLGELVALPEDLAAFRVHRGSWSGALAADQARQAAELLVRVGEEWDEVTSDDVALGLRRARRAARTRQLLYALLDSPLGGHAVRLVLGRAGRTGLPWPAAPGATMEAGSSPAEGRTQ